MRLDVEGVTQRWPIFRALHLPLARLPMLFERAPSLHELNDALSVMAGVRFAAQPPRPRFGPPKEHYHARVATGIVPTREGNWHDVMNALVWAQFPMSKRALHLRQERCILTRLGPNRTAEEDTLAILDEGGVLVRTTITPQNKHELEQQLMSGIAECVVFGHALYECAAFDRELVVPRAAILVGAAGWDEAFAVALNDSARFREKSELLQVPLRFLRQP
jgi:hypothetical protein